MRRPIAIAPLLLLALATAASAAPFEYATLSAGRNGNDCTWATATESVRGEIGELLLKFDVPAGGARSTLEPALLNALSKQGWDVVSSSPLFDGRFANPTRIEYVLRRDLAPKPAAVSGSPTTRPAAAAATEQRVAVSFADGHDTDPGDRGRPVALIAGALGVTADQFRDAFSKVTPARGKAGPTPEQERQNKRALMDALAPLGVTNERLDEVSNFYRYRREAGRSWPQASAEAYATVVDGKVAGVIVTRAGSGYSSPPTATIPSMPGVRLLAVIGFDPDFGRNGRVAGVGVQVEPR